MPGRCQPEKISLHLKSLKLIAIIFRLNHFIFYASNLVHLSFSLPFTRQRTAITALTCVEREKIICRKLAQSNQLYLAQMWEDQPEKSHTISKTPWHLKVTNFRSTILALQALRGSPPWSGEDSSMLSKALSSILTAPLKTFAWTLKRPCARQLSTKNLCKKVSFATIGWTNWQRTTHPDQIDWSITW